MTLIQTLLFVATVWISLALAEIFPILLVTGLSISLWLIFYLKSWILRGSLIILIVSLGSAMWKSYVFPPNFFRYYQYFNPNLTSFLSPVSNKTLSTYQNGLNNKLVFSQSNWISDGERLIHMAAIEPLVFAQKWLLNYEIKSLSYLGPTPPELCQRIKKLKLDINLFYSDIHQDSASCGVKINPGQSMPNPHIVTYGEVENSITDVWIQRFKKANLASWSIWKCSENFSQNNLKNLPPISQIASENSKVLAAEFFLELPFVNCEITTKSGVFKFNNALLSDPVLSRLLMIAKEEN